MPRGTARPELTSETNSAVRAPSKAFLASSPATEPGSSASPIAGSNRPSSARRQTRARGPPASSLLAPSSTAAVTASFSKDAVKRRLASNSSRSRALSSCCSRNRRALLIAALADSPSASTSSISSAVKRRSASTTVSRRMPCGLPADRSGRLRHVFCRHRSIARRRSGCRPESETVLLHQALRLEDRPLTGQIGEGILRPHRVRVGVDQIRRRLVRRPVDDRVVMRPILIDRGVGRTDGLRGHARHDAEHVVDGDRRRQRPAGVEQRGHAARLLALLPVQPGVADRRRGRAGEQPQELLLVVGEATRATRLGHPNDPQSHPAELERYLHDGLLVVLDHELSLDGVQVVVVDVLLQKVTLADHRVALGPFAQVDDRSDVVEVDLAQFLRPHRDVGHRACLGVVLVDVAELDIQRLADLPGDDLGHLVEVERRRQRRADFEDGLVRVPACGSSGRAVVSHRTPPRGSCPGAWPGTEPCRHCAPARPGRPPPPGSRPRRC